MPSQHDSWHSPSVLHAHADEPAAAGRIIASRGEARAAGDVTPGRDRAIRHGLRMLVGVGLGGALLAGLGASAMAADRQSEPLVAESFDRLDTGAWGATDSGQRWRFPKGSAGIALATNGGVMTLPAPRSHGSAMLEGKGTNVRDVTLAFNFTLDRMPGHGGAVIEAIARKSAAGSYRAQIRIAPRGGVWLSFGKERHGRPAGSVGRKALLRGWRYGAGQAVDVRFGALEQDATQLRLKVWRAGTAEPRRWQLVGDDVRDDVGAPGRVGIAASLTKRATNVPLQVRFDDLRVTRTQKAKRAPVTRAKPRGPDGGPQTQAQDPGVPAQAVQPAPAVAATTAEPEPAPAATPTPAPALGAYPPSRSSLTFEPVPSLAMPGYLVEIRDPTFGGYVTRISDVAGQRNSYAKQAAWNADGSLAAFFGYGYRLLDGKTFEDLGSLSGVPGRPTWSNVDPDMIWGTNNSDNRLKHYSVSTGKTTYRAFTGYTEVDLGNGEGNISDNDRYIGLIAYPDGGGVHCLMYDSQLDQVLGSESIGAEPDWLSTSPSGAWIVVRYPSAGTGQTQGFWLFDQQCRRVRQLASEASHADFARSQDGTELLIHHRSRGRITARQLSADKSWNLLLNSAFTNGHVSGRAIDRWGWVYLSNHVYYSNGTEGHDQIVAVKTDGSGTVQVFAHAHTIQPGNTYDYDASTHAVPNRDGTKVMWGGRWDASGSIYSYVVAMETRAR